MNEWVWGIDGLILTGETKILGEKHYTAWMVDEWMSMDIGGMIQAEDTEILVEKPAIVLLCPP